MLIDSHCHLEKFHAVGELAPVLERAAAAGVGRVITIGTSARDWGLYRDLAAAHPGVVAHTVGLHPCDVGEDWQEELLQLPSYFAEDPAPVGLGEVGLDHFHLPQAPDEAAEIKARQLGAFRHQLNLALQFDCPVVVHSRNAFQPCVDAIDASGVDWAKVVFHCFADGPDEVAALNRRGGRASFTGIVTYKSAGAVRAAVAAQGPGLAMVETDAPYLAPVPHRGKPNEPAYVALTAACCAQLLELDEGTFAQRASENTCAFFGL